jgi:hypothetical protein
MALPAAGGDDDEPLAYLEEARRLHVAVAVHPAPRSSSPHPSPSPDAVSASGGGRQKAILKKNRAGSPIGRISIIVPPEQDYTVRFELGTLHASRFIRTMAAL